MSNFKNEINAAIDGLKYLEKAIVSGCGDIFFHEKLEGRVNANNGIDVNVSSFFSAMIKEAGKCSHYNSDIFYDLQTIDNRLKNFDYNNEEHYMPIVVACRKMGVDGNHFFASRMDAHNKGKRYISFPEEYFSIFLVTFSKSKEWADLGYVEINVSGIHV